MFMDRTIQPEIQPLKNFHIQTPVRNNVAEWYSSDCY